MVEVRFAMNYGFTHSRKDVTILVGNDHRSIVFDRNLARLFYQVSVAKSKKNQLSNVVQNQIDSLSYLS